MDFCSSISPDRCRRVRSEFTNLRSRNDQLTRIMVSKLVIIDWNNLVIEASTLALYDFDRELGLEVWKSQKSGKHIFIGSIDFTIT